MIDKEIIMKLAKQAGMNFTPAQFSWVLEDARNLIKEIQEKNDV